MRVDKILANSSERDLSSVEVDTVQLEWWELSKRIQRKKTTSGRDVAMKFLAESIAMKSGDVLYQDDSYAIVVEVLPTPVIVISPKDMTQMATVCYEIGNKHMPLFIDSEELLLPYEAPMFRWLESAGYAPTQQERRLEHRLRSNVAGHSHEHSHDSIIGKVINFATKR